MLKIPNYFLISVKNMAATASNGPRRPKKEARFGRCAIMGYCAVLASRPSAGATSINIYMPIDPDNSSEYSAAMQISDRMAERALTLGGTCTDEHGIGMGKLKFMEQEDGLAWDVMRGLKRQMDLLNILNPVNCYVKIKAPGRRSTPCNESPSRHARCIRDLRS